MPLTPGSMLGPYEIVSALGAGGMGEVYRARDAKLNRDVAIKVLPEAFASDPERLARFVREAQILASLNHPHIAQVYGLEGQALVMELVEGETIADRLVRGPIPIDDALAMARQIADALEAAHEQGIIHRDLKPANIKVTPGGKVKVLDFGLAKLADGGPAEAGHYSGSMSPTMLSPAMMTGMGMLLGTAAYMAPEQARGRPVDRRTDIWAFGCVLYEMLAGRRIFPEGETISDAVAAVLTHEPDWSGLPAATPWQIARVLRRCLQRDPQQRPHHIADVRLEIVDAIAGAATPGIAAVSAVQRASPYRLGLPWIATVLMAVVAVAAIWTRQAATLDAPSPAATRLEIHMPAGAELFTSTTRTVAISPDGSNVAFVAVLDGRRQVFLRRMDRFESLALRGTDGATMCFFSSDGQSVAVVTSAGVLRTVSLDRGTVETVAEGVSFLNGGTWLPDGRIVFVRADALWQVPRTGGMPKALTTVSAERREAHNWPIALPDGQTVLFAVTSDTGSHIEALTLATGERRTVIERGTLPLYGSGQLLFFRGGALLAAPFDAAQVRVTGPAVQATTAVTDTPNNIPIADISTTGTLVYSPTTAVNRLVWVARDGTEQALNDVLRSYTNPRMSADGNRIAVQAGDIWVQDLARATFTRVGSVNAETNAFPIWTADGQELVYRTSAGLSLQNVDGRGAPRVLAQTSDFDYPAAVTADGDFLIILHSSVQTSFDLYLVPVSNPSAMRPLLNGPAYEGGARLSPDERWLTYVSNESGQNEIYLRPFPGVDRRWQVSVDGGSQVVWNPNGKEIFYRNGNKMMAVTITANGQQVSLDRPRMLFERRYAFGAGITIANYDVSGDGQRFVMVKGEDSAGRLNVEMNWLSALSRDGTPAEETPAP